MAIPYMHKRIAELLRESRLPVRSINQKTMSKTLANTYRPTASDMHHTLNEMSRSGLVKRKGRMIILD